MSPPPNARRTLTLALALGTFVLLGGLGLAAYHAVTPDTATGTAGTVRVTVTGPDAEPVWNGSVAVDANATVLDALLAAADAGGFDVRTRAYAMGTYVTAIAGHEAEGSAGWVYEVERNGTREWADRAADRYAVTDGDAVHWSWSDAPPGA